MKRVPIYAKTLLEVGKFFGRDRSTCEEWIHKGCPGEPGKYDLFEISEWRNFNLLRGKLKRDHTTATAEAERRLKARKLEQEIELNDFKFAKQTETVIPRAHIVTTLERMAEKLRAAGELLLKQYGLDAQEILTDALEELAAETEKSLRPKKSNAN